ncbi:hypothetical protein [Roseibacillus ishigakijimensis]|uniref:hypothetical protein n=1 Tax=Roseibacillus ishigakijimensis TaxID=454146 RepID=UPI001F3EE521|nr:hypothetical protein [Roseibacillus ishigakijimensis]
MAHIRVEVVDAHGVLVPKAAHEVTFEINGAGERVAVDSGSITSHEPFQADRRRAFQGKALLLVRGRGEGRNMEITARAAGLRPAVIELVVE